MFKILASNFASVSFHLQCSRNGFVTRILFEWFGGGGESGYFSPKEEKKGMWFTQLTTSSNVLIIFDVADSAVVKRTDGPEETDDG